jgi:NAD-dependent deacetylase sirtuin 4
MGRIGVTLEDQQSFYEPEEEFEFSFGSGLRELAIVTQNVDSLHQRAGSREVVQLHGGGNLVKCMNCAKRQDRNEFHLELESANQGWLSEALQGYEKSTDMRPDGDALVKEMDYNHFVVPNCPHCNNGFFKTDVVFFGDTVPKHRVRLCEEAIKAADGVLVVGSSLAVHSAYRHVRAASSMGISTAIVNVGETRAEAEGLDHILKVEAPAGDTLSLCAELFQGQVASTATGSQ